MTTGRALFSSAAALFMAAALFFTPRVALAQSKIAVIDVRRAVLETEEGLRVQATLKKLADARNGEIDQKSRQLEADKVNFDKKVAAGKADKAQLQKEAEQLQKAFNDVQQLNVSAQREMQQKQEELTAPILGRVLDISRRIASQEGYEMILDKAVVPYFRADLEITDRAIQMYNGGQFGNAPAKGTTPPANAPKTPPATPPAAPKAPPAKK